jgi:DNA-binding MarR family transcriptional regulator
VHALDTVETELALLARSIESINRRYSLYAGLDRASYLILRSLTEAGPASVNALALRLGLDGSTVTRQTAAMESRGLIDRVADPHDRRASIATATDRGRARMEDLRRRRLAMLDAIFDAWPERDLTRLGATLHRLNDTLAAADVAALPPPHERTAG